MTPEERSAVTLILPRWTPSSLRPLSLSQEDHFPTTAALLRYLTCPTPDNLGVYAVRVRNAYENLHRAGYRTGLRRGTRLPLWVHE